MGACVVSGGEVLSEPGWQIMICKFDISGFLPNWTKFSKGRSSLIW